MSFAQFSGYIQNINSRSFLLFLICLGAFAMVATPALSAKKQRPRPSNGCSIEVIQSLAAASCIRKFEKDIMDGAAYPRQLFCDATGVRCCQSDGTRTFGCKRV